VLKHASRSRHIDPDRPPAAAGGLRSQVPDLVHGPRSCSTAASCSRLVDENGPAPSTGGRRRASTWHSFSYHTGPSEPRTTLPSRRPASIRLESFSVRKTSQGASMARRRLHPDELPWAAALPIYRSRARWTHPGCRVRMLHITRRATATPHSGATPLTSCSLTMPRECLLSGQAFEELRI
jgi:hypothetical protein